MKFPWSKKPAPKAAEAGAAPTSLPSNMASAFVILSTSRMPRAGDVLAAIAKRNLDFNATTTELDAPAKAIVGFGMHGAGLMALMFMDVPNPLSPNDSCVATAWWWPDDWAQLQKRKGHVMIHVPHDDPKQRSILLAQLTAAVVETTDAMAVIWNPADAVWQSEVFLKAVDATPPGQLPHSIAIAVRVGNDTENLRADGSPMNFGITNGLAEFGLMEIEVRGYPGYSIDMCATMINLASYLVDNGPVIGDGHTIGATAEQRMTVRHMPSTVVLGKSVYRLYMPS
ncbi:MAG: DUF4261 domain-containing protein [Hyphomicrobiaceae bacterium]